MTKYYNDGFNAALLGLPRVCELSGMAANDWINGYDQGIVSVRMVLQKSQ